MEEPDNQQHADLYVGMYTVSRKKGPTLFCTVHNFYKLKHITLIFGKQHHVGTAKLLL